MNENRMKTTVNTGDVSLPPAQSAGLGRKMGGDEVNVTKKLIWGTAKWLATPSEGRKIATTGKAQYDPMDNNSNGKSRFTSTSQVAGMTKFLADQLTSAQYNGNWYIPL